MLTCFSALTLMIHQSRSVAGLGMMLGRAGSWVAARCQRSIATWVRRPTAFY